MKAHLSAFQDAGRILFEKGLVTGSSGNLSIRLDDHLIITTHGSTLQALSVSDLVKTPLSGEACAGASWELPVHRAIYSENPALAVAHAHPPFAVALSLQKRGKHLTAKVAVLDAGEGIVPGAIAEEMARELQKSPIVMVKGHGTFATGKTLAEACRITLAYEAECMLTCSEHHIVPSSGVE